MHALKPAEEVSLAWRELESGEKEHIQQHAPKTKSTTDCRMQGADVSDLCSLPVDRRNGVLYSKHKSHSWHHDHPVHAAVMYRTCRHGRAQVGHRRVYEAFVLRTGSRHSLGSLAPLQKPKGLVDVAVCHTTDRIKMFVTGYKLHHQ